MASYLPRNREAARKGRNAAIRQRIRGIAPVNPYRKGTQAARYFDRAVSRATDALDTLSRIGR